MSDEIRALIRAAEALEGILAELRHMNKEGITVWGGSTMEEN